MHFFTFLLVSLLCYQCPGVATTLINVTVDDQSGDPHISYTPEEAWIVAQNCSHCSYSSSSEVKAYNQTWHESFFSSNISTSNGAVSIGSEAYPTASFRFNGSAVYVICIIPPLPNITSQLVFSIDGQEVGSYPPIPIDIQHDWQYNVIVYENSSLLMTEHLLRIQNGRNEGPDSIMLLDSIVYSYDSSGHSLDSRASGGLSKRIPPAIIIGAVLGGFTALVIFSCGVLLSLRIRRRAQKATLHQSIEVVAPRWWSLNPFRFKATLSQNQGPSIDKMVSHHSGSIQSSSRAQSILAWQQQTQQAMRSVELAPQDMSEALSSYYENATASESQRVRTPPPAPRRYIITNK